jgi:hypothetical protein
MKHVPPLNPIIESFKILAQNEKKAFSITNSDGFFCPVQVLLNVPFLFFHFCQFNEAAAAAALSAPCLSCRSCAAVWI